MYHWMYPPPTDGTGGSNESTRINTKVTFRRDSSRQEKKKERLLGVSSSGVVGGGETERQRDRETEGVEMARRIHRGGNRRQTESPTSDRLHDDAWASSQSEVVVGV